MSGVTQEREQAGDLYRSASAVSFSEDGVVAAAEAGAAGDVGEIDVRLSDRDKRMLAIGTLIGAAGAIARVRYPYEGMSAMLERADAVAEHARRVNARDRKGEPLFKDGGC